MPSAGTALPVPEESVIGEGDVTDLAVALWAEDSCQQITGFLHLLLVEIAKPDASVEWQAQRAMLAAREAQVIYDGMGWTLRVGSVRLCDV